MKTQTAKRFPSHIRAELTRDVDAEMKVVWFEKHVGRRSVPKAVISADDGVRLTVAATRLLLQLAGCPGASEAVMHLRVGYDPGRSLLLVQSVQGAKPGLYRGKVRAGGRLQIGATDLGERIVAAGVAPGMYSVRPQGDMLVVDLSRKLPPVQGRKKRSKKGERTDD